MTDVTVTRLCSGVLAIGLATLGSCASFAGDLDMIYDPTRPMGLAYTIADIVTDGLIAHYDGEFNQGLNAPHDSAATTWANLVEGAPEAVFRFSTSTSSDASGAGEWVADGYRFQWANYAVMSEGLELGTNFTVQLVGDFDTSAQIAAPPESGTTHYPNFLANKEDFGFFIQINAGTEPGANLQWKADAYQFGTLGRPRPTLNPWRGRYISGGMDAETIFLSQSDAWNSGKERTSVTNIPAIAWSWGGSVGNKANAAIRYALGTVHAVRIYNRLLSNEELRRNYGADNTRFFHAPPVTNVIVATSIGTFPESGSGVYAVNGAYDFAAPPNHAAGELTYACTGYQLEHWNEMSNFWENAEAHTGLTYAYTNCLAHAKVRLTWLMTPVAGVRHYADDAYVTNGLLLHFDGICNAGLGQPHDSQATTWKNLVPGGADAVLERLDGEGVQAGEWRENGYWCSGCEWWRQTEDLYAGPSLAVQAATLYTAAEQKPVLPEYEGDYYPTVFGTIADNCNIFANTVGKTMYLKADDVTGGPKTARSSVSWKGLSITALLDYSCSALFQTVPDAVTLKAEGVFKRPVGLQRFCLGGIPMEGKEGKRCMTGLIQSIRLYDRLLNKDELEWNLDLDNVRFRGALPALASNVVEVVGADPSAAASDYYRLYGSYTFTVPGAVTNADGRVWICTGSRVETWNDTSKQYVPQSVAEGTACTLMSDDTIQRRRLTWIWQIAAAIKRVTDFGVGDYVQEGLEGHWDGIRNAGANLPHDDTAATWADLSYRQVPLALAGANPDSGSWVQDGYSLMQESYWQMASPVTIGMALTLQEVVDIDFASHTNSYPNYFAITSDLGLFTQKAGSSLSWKFDSFGGKPRATLSNWGGKFITAACDDANMYLTQTAAYGTPNARSEKKSVGAYRWSFGSASGGNAPTRYSQGVYKAIRLYSRMLTAEELAWNRLVDEARFNHVLLQTNVLVASDSAYAQGVEPSDAYLVQGQWNFSAAPRQEADGIRFIPTGYTLETLTDGVWSAPESFTGTNYVYDASVQTRPVRLTWQWRRKGGFVVNFR
ncbi:MAG: hypothetical protein MJ240_04515 [Kiritimatiellae bacterium]|nr:hypothetical protein [Kiritimatiellia bacterium]